jgi:hypothetical protein
VDRCINLELEWGNKASTAEAVMLTRPSSTTHQSRGTDYRASLWLSRAQKDLLRRWEAWWINIAHKD